LPQFAPVQDTASSAAHLSNSALAHQRAQHGPSSPLPLSPEFLPPAPRAYKTRTKNAQEAHEAIRPTNPGLLPASLPPGVAPDCQRLYELIWRRALACQMADAETLQARLGTGGGRWGALVHLRSCVWRPAVPRPLGLMWRRGLTPPASLPSLPPTRHPQVTVDASTPQGDLTLRATGSAVTFQGYLAAYGPPPAGGAAGATDGAESDAEGSGEDGGGEEGDGGALSDALRKLKQGDALGASKVSGGGAAPARIGRHLHTSAPLLSLGRKCQAAAQPLFLTYPLL
jgi:hypothetical protein